MTQPHQLVVIMLDGFRWDYWTRDLESMKAFQNIQKLGVQAVGLEPVFPVLSFPNWTTIGTGVYADNHGIIGNYMLDPSQEPSARLFHLRLKESQQLPHWWDGSPEPIWTTATKQGKRVFTRFWSRSDVPLQGVLPEDATGYEEAPGVEAIERTLDIGVDKLLEGFDLVMLYGEHIDNVGHAKGPESEEMKDAVRKVDAALFRFFEKLEKNGISEKVNIVIVSDHGMTATGENSGTHYLNLGDFISEDDVELVLDSGTNLSVLPASGKEDDVYEALQKMEGALVYKREEIPADFRYRGSKHCLGLHVLAKPGYFIRGLQSEEKQIPYREFNAEKPYCEGVHGYTPDLADQRGIFVARGPAFKQGLVIPVIQMVDIYQILAHVAEVKPKSHDGSWKNVAEIFSSPVDI